MRYFFLAYLLAVVLVVGFAGFRGDRFTHPPMEILDDMDQQAKVKAQQTNFFFADGAGSRKPVAGTVPVGLHLAEKPAADGGFQNYGFGHGSDYYNTGVVGEFYGDGFPEQIKVDTALLNLGRERYEIACSRCHGESGNGAGIMKSYGILTAANLLGPNFTNPADPAYRPNGAIFEAITKGKGLMGSYAANVPVKERWAIIAWIRTLGMARTAPVTDPAVKAVWDVVKPKEEAKPAAAPGAALTTPVAAN